MHFFFPHCRFLLETVRCQLAQIEAFLLAIRKGELNIVKQWLSTLGALDYSKSNNAVFGKFSFLGQNCTMLIFDAIWGAGVYG